MDLVSFGVFAKCLPQAAVREVLPGTRHSSFRESNLSAHVVLDNGIALALNLRSSTHETWRY